MNAAPSPEPVMAFLTVGGAHVLVTKQPAADAYAQYRWECQGCSADDHGYLNTARDSANKHAERCRAVAAAELLALSRPTG